MTDKNLDQLKAAADAAQAAYCTAKLLSKTEGEWEAALFAAEDRCEDAGRAIDVAEAAVVAARGAIDVAIDALQDAEDAYRASRDVWKDANAAYYQAGADYDEFLCAQEKSND